MIESFRWYGPMDPVTLQDILQTGASHVVSALHNISNGEIWKQYQINEHKEIIQKAGLKWEVVESVPVHEDIKRRKGNYKSYLENYKKTIENLASCGINIICYNFMPLLDWTRTHLNYTLKDGSTALYFNSLALAAFDLFILKRKNSEISYTAEQIKKAKKYFDKLSQKEKNVLTNSIIEGLPGAEEGYNLNQFKHQLSHYEMVTENDLRKNLIHFLEAIIPTAERLGVKMCIHPDDPPISILGIPRVVSKLEDLEFIFSKIPSISNGLTYCTGSLGVLRENNLSLLFKKFASRIHFLHLRSTKREGDDNFFEANHLEGDVDMFEVVSAIINEEQRRKDVGLSNYQIAMRPDHGHRMLDDLTKDMNPGYSVIGRLRGLAELRGLALGIGKSISRSNILH